MSNVTPVRPSAPTPQQDLTPDSLIDRAFESEMDRINEYQTKYPFLDMGDMVKTALTARETRKQDVYLKKLASYRSEANSMGTCVEFLSDEEGGGERSSQRNSRGSAKRKKGSPAQRSAKSLPSGQLTDQFLTTMKQAVRAATTRCIIICLRRALNSLA